MTHQIKAPHFLITKRRTLKLLPLRRNSQVVLFNSSQFICTAYVWCHYLVNVYSLSPEWRFMAEKVPMQPRSRLSRPVFHVTKSGLKKQNKKHSPAPKQLWIRTKLCFCPVHFGYSPKGLLPELQLPEGLWLPGNHADGDGRTLQHGSLKGGALCPSCAPCLWFSSLWHMFGVFSFSSAQDSISSNFPYLSPLNYS